MTERSDLPVVVITGAARGIGQALASELATTHRVAMLDRDEIALTAAADKIGAAAKPYVCDITDQQSVDAAIVQVVADLGRIDAAVSNAGIGSAGTARHLHPDALAAQLEVNLTGNWRFIYACLPELEKAKGYVLGVASAAAILAPPGEGFYGASKAGLEALLDTLRVEVDHLGIGVGVAYLMFIDTPMVREGDQEHADLATMRANLPGAASKTLPVAAAAAALAAAVRGRRRDVFVPSSLKLQHRLRGVIRKAADKKMAQLAPMIDALTAQKVAERGPFDAAFDKRARTGIKGE